MLLFLTIVEISCQGKITYKMTMLGEGHMSGQTRCIWHANWHTSYMRAQRLNVRSYDNNIYNQFMRLKCQYWKRCVSINIALKKWPVVYFTGLDLTWNIPRSINKSNIWYMHFNFTLEQMLILYYQFENLFSEKNPFKTIYKFIINFNICILSPVRSLCLSS